MSLSKIGEFQRIIYELLSKDANLLSKIKGLFLFPPRDALPPFLLINIIKLTDFSKYDRYNYDIEFEICIFAKDNNLQRTLLIADNITSLLKPDICSSSDFILISLKFMEAYWTKGTAANTSKISLCFKALIAGIYE